MPDDPSKRPAFTGDFRVGEWLVQPSLDRLCRGDSQVHLRRQLTDLLLLLARHAGRTVPKEVILKEVWATQYVGESVLTRCITELRHALEDSAHAPRIIETIPKRGYRLVAPVEFLENAAPQSLRADRGEGLAHASAPGRPPCDRLRANGPGSTSSGTDGVEEGRDVVETTADGAGVALQRGTAAAASAAAGGGSDPGGGTDRTPRVVADSRARRMIRGAPWTALKAAVVVGVAVTVGAGEWSGPPVVSERDTVLLADVVNSTGNRVFDDALRLALAVNLEQAPFLRVMPQAAVRSALQRMRRSPDERVVGALALEVCRREGAAVLLAGSITALGSRYVVGIEALACATGDSVGRAMGEARDKEHVLTVLEQVATRIRLKLGESRKSLRQYSIPLVRATTPSLEALQAITLGDDNRDHGRVANALEFYRQATEIDSGFAAAWARRGAAAQTLDLRDESLSAFRRAYDLREKVSQPERFYIEAHYYRSVAANPQKAIETYQAWKRLYPGSLVPPTNLASILGGLMGQYDAALVEAREAVRLGPYSSIAFANLVVAYLGSSRIAEAREAIADASRRGVCDRLLHHYLLTLALFDGDGAALEREVLWASSDPTAALDVWEARASAAMAAGRLGEARRLWAEALIRARETGGVKRVAQVQLAWAESEALVGDPRRARPAAEAALDLDRSPATELDAATVFALLGDGARARSMLENLAGQTSLGPVERLVQVPLARALLESGQGQGDRAIAILQPVVPFESGSQSGPAPLAVRGLVELSRHRPSEAVPPLDKLIRMRVLYPASPWVPFARLALARALYEAGDTTRGAAAYDEFLESWKNADGDAPLLKVARRARAAVPPAAK